MTYSNEELARRFARGGRSGKSNRMEIRGNKLVGYDWALYAKRSPKGKVTVYEGWRGYSPSTSRHINTISGYADKRSKKRERATPKESMRPFGSRSWGI